MDDISPNHIDLFVKPSVKSPRGHAIDQEIAMAVESWIHGDLDETIYLTALAEWHLKMSDQDFEDNYDEEG
jgi:hypothetical protein